MLQVLDVNERADTCLTKSCVVQALSVYLLLTDVKTQPQRNKYISFRFISFQFISQQSAIPTVRSRLTMNPLPNHLDGPHIHSKPFYSFLKPQNHFVADNNQFPHFYSLRKNCKCYGRQDEIRNLTKTLNWM